MLQEASDVDSLAKAAEEAWQERRRLSDRLICLQEELDWRIYAGQGLCPQELAREHDVISTCGEVVPSQSARPMVRAYCESSAPAREIERLFEFCGL